MNAFYKSQKTLYYIVGNTISYAVAKQFDPELITYGDLFFLKWAILGVFWRIMAKNKVTKSFYFLNLVVSV